MKRTPFLLLGLSITIVILLLGESFLQNVPQNKRTTGSSSIRNVTASMDAEQSYQNLTITGNIVVENGTYLIENMELHLIGNITARNDATLMVKNAKFFVTNRKYTYDRERIVLTNSSKLIAENATIYLDSAYIGDESYITARDEALVNITDSKLYGHAYIIGEQNSKTYVNHSILKGPNPSDLEGFVVLTQDNATARIQDSEIDVAGPRDNSSIYVLNSIIGWGISGSGNGVIEVENSNVDTCQWLDDNCTLRILNCTVVTISFEGSTLNVQNSRIGLDVLVYRNSTAWLKNTSMNRVQAYDRSQIWLINSPTREISTFEDGRVFIGWQLPVFGTVAVPHTWMPILYAAIFLSATIIIIVSAVFLNKRRKLWQSKKMRQFSESNSGQVKLKRL